MSNQHTPGPWRQEGLSIRTQQGVIAICPPPSTIGTFDCAANARLIAAAPELLAALERISNSLQLVLTTRAMRPKDRTMCQGIINECEEAITKAKEKK